jgi:hypothetical protein
MIGPRVLLTAAHCVPPFADMKVEVNDEVWLLDCERHPAYARYGFRLLFDYALCLAYEAFPTEIELDGDPKLKSKRVPLIFERISLDPRDALPAPDPRSRWVLVGGYGCSYFEVWQPVGTLTIGFARIAFNDELGLITGIPGRNDSYVICQGDSGGGAYRLKSKDEDRNGPRVLIGINRANLEGFNQSFLAKTSSPAFVQFFHSWRRRNGNPKVCGIDKDIEDRCHP